MNKRTRKQANTQQESCGQAGDILGERTLSARFGYYGARLLRILWIWRWPMVISMQSYKQTATMEERYWQAVVERDRSFAGVFVAGVRSTGVYCRPGCPSRMPRRDRVAFFSTPSEAEEAGFRAC